MSRFFKPYEGTRPYLFISYAHKQSEEVVSTIRILHEKGWRLWYDEGIPAGSDWPANIAGHMQGCAGVLFFESERALESTKKYSEDRYASVFGSESGSHPEVRFCHPPLSPLLDGEHTVEHTGAYSVAAVFPFVSGSALGAQKRTVESGRSFSG